MKNDEDIANVVVMWLTFIGILFGVSILGLSAAVIKGVMEAFGL